MTKEIPNETDSFETLAIQTKENFDQQGVKAILIDFDDTLIYTHLIFEHYNNLFITQICQENPHINPKEFDNLFRYLNKKAYSVESVSPDRYQWIIDVLHQEHPHINFQHHLDTLLSIYKHQPELRPQALEFIQALQQADIPLVLVTHANQDWTDFKLDSLDLRQYFQQVIVIDEHHYKDQQAWLDATNQAGYIPSECIIIGDSLKTDIISTAQAGYRNVIWTNPKDGWSHYSEGEQPHNIDIHQSFHKILNHLSHSHFSQAA